MITTNIKEYIVQRELIMNDDKNKEKIIRAIKKFCKNLKIATSIDISNDEVFEKCLYNQSTVQSTHNRLYIFLVLIYSNSQNRFL